MGFVTDLLVNRILRYYASPADANDRWMMVTGKGFRTLPLNLLYAYWLLLFTVLTYNAVNAAVIAVRGLQDTIPVGVEPILFGLIVMGWDMLFLAMKRVVKSIAADAAKQNRRR